MLSHDALRLDLADLQRLLDALAAQVAAGRPLKKWQLEAAQGAWRYHQHMLMVHHDTEEREQLDFVWGDVLGLSMLSLHVRVPASSPPVSWPQAAAALPGVRPRRAVLPAAAHPV